MNKQFWYPIITAVIASIVLSSLSGLYQSGQYQNKIDQNSEAVKDLQRSIINLKDVVTEVNGDHVAQHQRLDGLERDVGKIDQVVEKLNSMDKKMTEFQVTQQYVRRDIQDFRDLVSRVNKNGNGESQNAE